MHSNNLSNGIINTMVMILNVTKPLLAVINVQMIISDLNKQQLSININKNCY
jgi:hypothetical protein